MKKETLLVFSLLLSTCSVSAQDVVSAQGDSYSNASANIDFTIGEVIIDTGTDGTNDLTQGFHQTNWNFAGLDDQAPQMEVTVFPNPTSEVLNISTETYAGVVYKLYDAQGKLVANDILNGYTTTINVNQCAPGTYSLVLEDKNQLLKTFKLIKTP
jgi:hypothetical protein